MTKPKMTKPKQTALISRDEAKIRQAFYRSILGFILIGIVIFILFQRSHKNDLTSDQAEHGTVNSVNEIPKATNTIPPPSIHFTDITKENGINFIHVNGAYGEHLLPETMGSGAVFFDFDNDADQDLFLINSRYWAGHEKPPVATSQLYENNGEGQFTDVSDKAGLELELFGMGAAAGDFNADGWQDLYVYGLNKNLLLENQQGRFIDITEKAGVSGKENAWSSGAAFFDYDQDGDLDLLVANYIRWSRQINQEIDFRLSGIGKAYGAPNHFIGTHLKLYRNNGKGIFSDVSQSTGLEVIDAHSGNPVGKALGLSLIDYDLDSDLDIFVANDTTRNFLFKNNGDGRFQEMGRYEGIAYSNNGKSTGGMGIDSGWIYNNQDFALLIGNFANEMSSFYISPNSQPPFTDEAVISGIGPDSRLALTFGLLFFDFDLDGRLDILQANGHIEPEINKIQSSQQYSQSAQLFWNSGNTSTNPFVHIKNTGDLHSPLIGRGAAYADIDNDGDLDIVITQNGQSAKLFRNDQQTGHHWLRVRLIGSEKNLDAIGARIEVKIGDQVQRRQVMPTRSYLSQVELTQTFGLGTHGRIDSLDVIWPNGVRQAFDIDSVDKTITLNQSTQ